MRSLDYSTFNGTSVKRSVRGLEWWPFLIKKNEPPRYPKIGFISVKYVKINLNAFIGNHLINGIAAEFLCGYIHVSKKAASYFAISRKIRQSLLFLAIWRYFNKILSGYLIWKIRHGTRLNIYQILGSLKLRHFLKCIEKTNIWSNSFHRLHLHAEYSVPLQMFKVTVTFFRKKTTTT